ncbi:ABC transporter permease [Collinsella provencensis]|uniref:ABC transporter permease n=1 Tax=Collinsella provencensis TaxID=1937461 RepID=UPI0018FEBC9D|nr:ABC transporter permease [Collinsella provencensis]
MKEIVQRFCRKRMSVVAGVMLILIIAACAFAPLYVHVDPLKQNLFNTYARPSAEHLLGTDNLGRDILVRLLYGGRSSLAISFSGVLSGTAVGVILGVIAGYFGGIADTLISRLIDVLLAFPGLLLAIVVVAILGSGESNTVVAIAIFSIPTVARMVRGEVLKIRSADYIAVCKVMGESSARVIVRHVIPNAISQIIVNVTLQLGTAILTTSALSFLGLGVQPPAPEWGAMLSSARDVLRSYPLPAVVPGIAITLVVVCFSLVGDGLRDALDPRLKNA